MIRDTKNVAVLIMLLEKALEAQPGLQVKVTDGDVERAHARKFADMKLEVLVTSDPDVLDGKTWLARLSAQQRSTPGRKFDLDY